MIPVPYDHVFAKLDKLRETSWGWMACCPAHDDKHPSLSLFLGDRGQLIMRCHRGGEVSRCRIDEIMEAMEITFDDLFRDNKVMGGPNGNGRLNGHSRVVATYDYVDEECRALFQVTRFEPKRFSFRRRGENGEWIWSVKGIRRVLYKLPDILASIKEQKAKRDHPRVVVVEGEKDCESAWKHKIPATTSPMGSCNWNAEFNPVFKDCCVAIVADRDAEPDKRGKFPGIEHANMVATNIYSLAAGVKILTLPGDGVKDLTDWVNYLTPGEDVAELFWDLVRDTPYWHPPRPVSEFEDMVVKELRKARDEYDAFNSIYEGAGVLLREFKEFEMALTKKNKPKKDQAILDELVQIAAMCRRIAEDKLGVKR